MREPATLNFNHDYSIQTVRDIVFFESDEQVLQFSGELVVNAADYLQRNSLFKDEDFVRHTAGSPMDMANSWYFLKLLEDHGVLLKKADSKWISAIGPANFKEMERHFFSKLRAYLDPLQKTPEIILVTDYLTRNLPAINKQFNEHDIDWMPVRFTGKKITIGPIFSKSTLCYDCVSESLLNMRRSRRTIESIKAIDEILKSKTAGNIYIDNSSPDTDQSMGRQYYSSEQLGYAAKFTAEYLQGYPEIEFKYRNNILHINIETHKIDYNLLYRSAHCVTCGELTLVKQISNEKPQLVFGAMTNSWREWSTNDALTRISRHYNALVGPICPYYYPEDQPVFVIPNLLYIVYAMHPFYTGAGLWKRTQEKLSHETFYYLAAGKGASLESAKVGAVCEGIERYSCMIDPISPFNKHDYLFQKTAEIKSLNEMQSVYGNRVLDLDEILLFSELQKNDPQQKAVEILTYDRVPEPIDTNDPIPWSKVWKFDNNLASLLEDKPFFVPTSFLYYGIGLAEVAKYTGWTSNGVAAGASLAEAAFYGLLEVIERDAVGIWWFNRIRRPELVLHYDECPLFFEMKTYFEDRRRTMWAIDITNDLEIPSFAVISVNANSGSHPIFGFGCHPDAKKALYNAVMECGQCIPSLDHCQSGEDFGAMSSWINEHTLVSDPYLQPLEKQSYLADYPEVEPDIEMNLRKILRTLERLELNAYLSDLSKSELEIKVARCIVPGLRYMWKRFAPGRLYDVPVQLDWLSSATKETDLNPVPVWF